MNIVIDNNILMSVLMSTRTDFRGPIFDKQNTVFAPNFLVAELFKYQPVVHKHSKLSSEELAQLLVQILEKIRFVGMDMISLRNRQKAYDLCKDVDIKDVLYVALTLEMNGKLWTNDKKLQRHLIKQGFKKFFNP